MRDPWYGHRDPFTGEPVGDRDEWLDWDYTLISALQVIEDNTDSNGLLSWVTDADRVEVIAKKKTDKFRSSVDRATNRKSYKPSPGEYFVPEVRLLGGEYPTYKEYVEKYQSKGLSEDRAGTQDPHEDDGTME